MTSKSSPWRQKQVMTPKKNRHNVKKYVMTSNSSSWCQRNVMTSKKRHDVKNFVITSKTSPWRQKHVMTQKSTSWRQNIIKTSTSLSWRKWVCHEAKNCVISVKTKSYLKCQIRFLFASVLRIFWHQFAVPEFSMIMCFSQFRWPLTYFSDISHNAGIIPSYKFFWPTHNEITVWYKAVDTQIFRQTTIHTDKHQHYNNLALRD